MTDCGYTAPIPGPDPGACPDCGSWRKAGMIHECVDATDRAVWREIAKRAEMRWMSVEDAEITVPARSVALASRELAAAAEQTQRTDQAFEEIARLREFGEHYSGAAQEAWDRIAVLEKALREIAEHDCEKAGCSPYMNDDCGIHMERVAQAALAAGSASPEEASAPCPSCGPDGTHDISFDRSLCACGAMHYFCVECGRQTDPCAAAVVSAEPTP